MTTELQEKQRVVAEFMGVKIGVDNYSWRPGYIVPLQEEHLNYHKSWDWQIPVWAKLWKAGKTTASDQYHKTIPPQDLRSFTTS